MDLSAKKLARKHPTHLYYDHTIRLREGEEARFGAIYGMSPDELISLNEYIEANLSKGFIRTCSSPAGAHVLFIKTGVESLKLSIDYRGINERTVKTWYPLPLIDETLMRLSKAMWLSKLNLRDANNLVHMVSEKNGK